ncbi:hypothetical protein [Rhizobium leguminosarum]|uniref:hypothetical protein n=1 Tax=Rhizobium leguminosarum TaxID=384 RepID=UPI00143F5900|nr:hypothetical protein [Rhizobium leguminosarum]NKL21186.1 hypothetical protein [Rhizobium leguminosarum bv. viciae]NKL56892.1 hypothetical protein [Rhizobium leguminosarum bv. viciae]
MGQSKHYMMHMQEVRAWASDVGVRAGLFTVCERHHLLSISDSTAEVKAYRIGNAMITSGEITDVDRLDLSDAIKKLFEQTAYDCPQCTDEDAE